MDRMTNERPTLLIWDSDDVPPEGKWTLVLWRSYGDGNNQIYSMPRLLEEQADTLRKRYLAWIYELGESPIASKRLIDHLELRTGFSYWWMTLIIEKCNTYKSFQIIDALKLLALENLSADHEISKIILESENKPLAKTLRLWCKNAGWTFEMRSGQKRKAPDTWLKRFYHSLSYPLQATIFLARYVWQRWPLKQKNESDGTEMTFVDYLIHLDRKALSAGRFDSNFWTSLVGALGETGGSVNWLHHYIQHESVSSPRQARDLINRFNQNESRRQYHACVDWALSIPLLLAALRDYIRLVCLSLRLAEIKRNFRPSGSKLDFWPLFKQDWLNSMRGPIAIWNSLCLNLFERTVRRLPRQKFGVYLQENQGWEMAFIYAWCAAGHGSLIGVPHSTVRYWDLRYFFDKKSYVRTGKNDLPLPNSVAVNGPAAQKTYREGGYPEEQIVEVEALRYLYLADLPSIKPGLNNPLTDPLRVLVCGDYLPAFTHRQMQWLVEAAPLLPADTIYIVKPHPNCPINAEDYAALPLSVTNEPLTQLLASCDVCYTSNITGAAVDAYCAGLPVVSVLVGNSFNMSPLRGMVGVMYVANHAELAAALCTARDCPRVAVEPYFCLDKGLPRWRNLLAANLA